MVLLVLVGQKKDLQNLMNYMIAWLKIEKTVGRLLIKSY